MVINYSVCWVIGILSWICIFMCFYEMKVKLTSAGWFPQTPAGVLWQSGSSCGSAQICSRFTEDKSQCWDAVDSEYLWRSLMLQQHVHTGFSRIQPRGWEGYILYQIFPKDFKDCYIEPVYTALTGHNQKTLDQIWSSKNPGLHVSVHQQPKIKDIRMEKGQHQFRQVTLRSGLSQIGTTSLRDSEEEGSFGGAGMRSEEPH